MVNENEVPQWSDGLARFLTSRRAKGLAPRTVAWYCSNLTIYLQWLATVPGLSWDDAHAIELFLAKQRELGLKDNTIHGRYRALTVWFGWLRKRKLIAASPMEMIDAPKVDQPPIQYMTLAEYQQLMASITGDAWTDHRDRCLLYLLFWCGLRISEACNMRQNDVNLAAKLVTVQKGKGGDGRFVPCGDDLYPMILAYLWSRPATELDWLFVGSDRGGGVRGQFTPGGAAIMMRRRCAAAGMRAISPHKGRHGLAMAMLNGGLEMSAVSKVLGHSSQKITAERYAKWLTATLVHQYTEVRTQLLAGKPK